MATKGVVAYSWQGVPLEPGMALSVSADGTLLYWPGDAVEGCMADGWRRKDLTGPHNAVMRAVCPGRLRVELSGMYARRVWV